MRAALAVEALKLGRAPITRVATGILVLGLPLVTAGMVWAARSGGDSPMAIKVRPMLIGTGWTAYLGVLGELFSVAAVLTIGMVVSWVVGREFTDRTIGALLAQPTPPGQMVLAKLAVCGVWGVLCGTASVLVAVPLGFLLGLGVPDAAAFAAGGKVVVLLVLAVLLTPPLAWVSTVLRGYLSGISTLIGIIVVTQIVTIAGVGGWFPYAAPSLWSGMGGPEAAAAVTPAQLALAVPVGLLGTWATARRWQRAELV